MDLRIILLASVLAISTTNAQDDCCILMVWNSCVVPCPMKMRTVGQKMNLMAATALPALKKTGGLKRLAALKKQSSLTVDQTCGTCEEMIQDFKALLTSPEGIQYWDDYLETVRINLWVSVLLKMCLFSSANSWE